MKYKSVIVTRRGSPEVLEIIENDLRLPLAGEARIKILATGVCQDDIAARIGNRPFPPKIPFVPGYTILGVVDQIGESITDFAVGDRVAALTTLGGYAEYIFLGEEDLVHVPTTLDPAEAVILILNYLVAYQVLHRSVQVKAGDRVLIIGASGGVGTAFLQLGKLANLTMYGIASRSKHSVLTELGVIPIDYHTQDFVEVIRQAEPDGLDFVFNGMGDDYIGRGLKVLRRGGTLVQYGAPQSFSRFLLLLVKFALFNLLPNGKAVKGYGTHRVDRRLLMEDWAKLFKLLEEGKIKPIITKKFPILEAAKANELLESGKVIGNIVLLAPELL
ncbi:MAG: medium chain dehydrogenase/reductase family protein [Candidatus Methylarchaceae archaeon HK01M]|nr:medium chain dehydrogenase/reductase family protein [Candidatus Methylarchaceae archaeon HK01M]